MCHPAARTARLSSEARRERACRSQPWACLETTVIDSNRTTGAVRHEINPPGQRADDRFEARAVTEVDFDEVGRPREGSIVRRSDPAGKEGARAYAGGTEYVNPYGQRVTTKYLEVRRVRDVRRARERVGGLLADGDRRI